MEMYHSMRRQMRQWGGSTGDEQLKRRNSPEGHCQLHHTKMFQFCSRIGAQGFVAEPPYQIATTPTWIISRTERKGQGKSKTSTVPCVRIGAEMTPLFSSGDLFFSLEKSRIYQTPVTWAIELISQLRNTYESTLVSSTIVITFIIIILILQGLRSGSIVWDEIHFGAL